LDADPICNTEQHGESDQHKHANVFCIWHDDSLWNGNRCCDVHADAEQDSGFHRICNRDGVPFIVLVKYGDDNGHWNWNGHRNRHANGISITVLHGYN
jgi:hypothetical protein